MIKKSEICQIIEEAFLPLKCVAELKEYNTSIGFKIYLPDGKSIKYENDKLEYHLDEHDLVPLILELRTKVEAKGIALAKWSFPNNE